MEITFIPLDSLVGRIAKLTERGVLLAKEYEELLGIGSEGSARKIHEYCHMGGQYEMSLIFINEPPFIAKGVTFYFLKEIGKGVGGDWHLYSLNQLIFCNE